MKLENDQSLRYHVRWTLGGTKLKLTVKEFTTQKDA